jgi:hypothetical protein
LTLNAALTGASAFELAALVREAVSTSRLRQLIWGLDFFAFHQHLPQYRDPDLLDRIARRPAVLLKDVWTAGRPQLFSLDTLEDSWGVLLRLIGLRQRLPPPLPAPWPEPHIRSALHAPGKGLATLEDGVVRSQIRSSAVVYANFELSSAALTAFGDAAAQVRATGGEVVLVVFPLSMYELDAIRRLGRWDTFMQWKRALLRAGPYWDFSGDNELARSGHAILRHVVGDDCSDCGPIAGTIERAAVWVDEFSIDRHLADQEIDRIDDGTERYRRLVADELAVMASAAKSVSQPPVDGDGPRPPLIR